MKRRELVKLLEDNGWYIKRNGGNHDIYTDGHRMFPKQKDIKKQPMFTCLQTKEYCY